MQKRKRAQQGTLWPEWPPAHEAIVCIYDTTAQQKAGALECNQERPWKWKWWLIRFSSQAHQNFDRSTAALGKRLRKNRR